VSGALTHVNTKTKAAYAFDTIEIQPAVAAEPGRALGRLPEHAGHLPTATTAAAHGVVDTNFVSTQAGIVYKPARTAASTCPTPARRPRRATTAATAWMR
jgi:catecholate siderophore receptor